MPVIEYSLVEALTTKVFRAVEAKIAVGIGLSTLTFFFDAVYKDALLSIIFLIVFDFLTAIAANKINGARIESAKVFRSAVKTAIYFLLISAGHLAENATNRVLPFMDETIMGFLAVTELISIMENVGMMGYAVPQKLLNQLEKFRRDK